MSRFLAWVYINKSHYVCRLNSSKQVVTVIWQKAASQPHIYFTMGHPFLCLKLPILVWGSGPHLIRFLGPTRVQTANGILIGSAVFAGLTTVIDRPTEHATQSATTGYSYICSTVMWPNKINLIQLIWCLNMSESLKQFHKTFCTHKLLSAVT